MILKKPSYCTAEIFDCWKCPNAHPPLDCSGKNFAAAAIGAKGGSSRGASKRRNVDYSAIAKKGLSKRWAAHRARKKAEADSASGQKSPKK